MGYLEWQIGRLEFVEEAIERRDLRRQILAFARLRYYQRGLRGPVHRVARHHLPVVEHTLRKRLTRSFGAQFLRET